MAKEIERRPRRLRRTVFGWPGKIVLAVLIGGGIGYGVNEALDPPRPAIVQPAEELVPTPTETPRVTPTAEDLRAAHFARLEELDSTLREGDVEAWLRRAGLSWDGELEVDARQIEEETTPTGRIVAAGVQVNARELRVPWPNVVTTDVPDRITETPNTRRHTPDLRNRSTLYTEVTANGPVTVWVDAQNWQQLAPR